ncbi:hypothetical protein EKH84_04290 [Cellulosilyticum sp. WCF-2]|nr:O-methyltransferase [Cellulosilyticum sp. WCF-2]QEH67653.1 hypothetical protein EKH84_04290 [Cellulosilyticum sp. WCF-2]
MFHKEFSIKEAISFEKDNRGYLKNNDALDQVLKYLKNRWIDFIEPYYLDEIDSVVIDIKNGSASKEDVIESGQLHKLTENIANSITEEIRSIDVRKFELNMQKLEIFDFSFVRLANSISLPLKEVVFLELSNMISNIDELQSIKDEIATSEEKDNRDFNDKKGTIISEIIKMLTEIATNRYLYNKPYGFIKLSFGEMQNALNCINWNKGLKNIIWLDYDDFLDNSMLDCLEKVVVKSSKGSLIIFSSSIGNNADERYTKLKENFQETHRIGKKIEKKMCDNKEIFKTVYNIVNNVVRAAISEKNNYVPDESPQFIYNQVLNCQYTDGTVMYTYAIFISDNEDNTDDQRYPINILKQYEWYTPGEEKFVIDMPVLTGKEINLINCFLPDNNIEAIKKHLPYVPEAEIKKYLKIYKYYPYYFDAAYCV